MGRIEDALRRAGAESPRSTRSRAGDDPFVSAWALSGVEAKKNDVVEVLPLKEPEPVHAAAGLHVVRPTLHERFPMEWGERLTVSQDADPALTDQFRRLAATLLQVQRNAHIKSLMVTSASPGDGKTLTALNLSIVLSDSYRRRVLLIDGDLRRPGITQAVNATGSEGLSEAIKFENRRISLVQLSDLLTLLPAGRPEADPLSGLTSTRMANLLQEAVGRFDWVVVDTPPLGAAADAGLLAPMVDGTLLVIRAGRTPHKAIQRAVNAIGPDRLLGVVLNAVNGKSEAEYGGDYYHYAQRTSAT